MSRLIVKNLPKTITEDKIRKLFSEKGDITDIQLKYTKDGKFRQFGFIGYRTEEQANDAISFFNNMCITTSKISVEPCANLGDTKKPKSWSKYAPDSTAYKNENPNKSKESKIDDKKPTKKEKKTDKLKELLEKYKDDPMFEEFMHLHGLKDMSAILSRLSETQEGKEDSENGEQNEEETNDSEHESTQENEDKIANKKISDLEYMKMLMKGTDGKPESKPRKRTEKQVKEKIQLYTVKLRGLPYACKKKDIKLFFNPLVPYTIRIPAKVKGFAYAGFKTEKLMNQALFKNKSFIAGKQIAVFRYTSNEEELRGEEPKEQNIKKKWVSQEEALKNEEDIAESGRIFLRNLSYTTSENDVQVLFEKYGPVTEINLPIDKNTRRLKGFGVITFLMPEHAVKAYSELDGSVLHGRMLHLLPGKAKDTQEDLTNAEGLSYKQKKALKDKATAGSSHNWNALFVGHNAVAAVIADQYGTSKEAVLDGRGKGSAAVRLALGETQVVAETREYLEQYGVHLDAFSQSATLRSKTVILAKNLPAHTEPNEIQKMFSVHGILGRVLIPPSGIAAIIEFLEPTEARKAFTKLAYSKFKSSPLYLEWAPENTFKTTFDHSAATKKVEEKMKPTQIVAEDGAKSDEEDKESEEEPEPDTTLFVKNLDFSTTDDIFHKHFTSCGKIHYANVALKKDPNNPGNKLSMGYGFVRFQYKAGADKALKTLQQSNLDGKSLEIKRSERTLQSDVKTSKKKTTLTPQTGSKILVRNIPFQAKKEEIHELFKAFGEIKALRLPKKMTLNAEAHRGFCFVDYVSKSDAKKAFKSLSQSTHLYGRRLVLEWASITEDGVDEIRKRTAKNFHPTEEVKSKKSVLDAETVMNL